MITPPPLSAFEQTIESPQGDRYGQQDAYSLQGAHSQHSAYALQGAYSQQSAYSSPAANPHQDARDDSLAALRSVPAYVPMRGWGPGSPGSSSAGRYSPPSSGNPHTAPIWLLAFYPVIHLAGGLVVGLMPAASPATVLTRGLFVSAVITALIALGIVGDHYALRSRSLPAPSPLWALLAILQILGAIAYFIARRVVLQRQGVRNHAPGSVFAIILLLSIGGSAVFAMNSFGALRTAAVLEALETQTEAELNETGGGPWTVSCPRDIDVTVIGTAFDCLALPSAGRGATFTVTVTPSGSLEVTDAAIAP